MWFLGIPGMGAPRGGVAQRCGKIYPGWNSMACGETMSCMQDRAPSSMTNHASTKAQIFTHECYIHQSIYTMTFIGVFSVTPCHHVCCYRYPWLPVVPCKHHARARLHYLQNHTVSCLYISCHLPCTHHKYSRFHGVQVVGNHKVVFICLLGVVVLSKFYLLLLEVGHHEPLIPSWAPKKIGLLPLPLGPFTFHALQCISGYRKGQGSKPISRATM